MGKKDECRSGLSSAWHVTPSTPDSIQGRLVRGVYVYLCDRSRNLSKVRIVEILFALRFRCTSAHTKEQIFAVVVCFESDEKNTGLENKGETKGKEK